MRLEDVKTVTFDGESTKYFRELETGPRDIMYLHTIKGGERLDNLAYRYYGDCSKFYLILEANLDVIKDPLEPLPAGKKIVIPSI